MWFELSLVQKCSANDAWQILQSKVSSLQLNLRQTLELDVCHIVCARKERENRKTMSLFKIYNPPRMPAELFFQS